MNMIHSTNIALKALLSVLFASALLLSSSQSMALNLGDTINNTAQLLFEKGGNTFAPVNSNTTQHTLILKPTTAEITFFSPPTTSSNSTCSNTAVNTTPSLGNATNSYSAGNDVYVQLADADQNIDSNTKQTITVTIETQAADDTPLDSEVLIGTETGVDTGVFVAQIPSTLNSTSNNDCELSVTLNSRMVAKYEDARNANNIDQNVVETSTALVDPFGTVFDSQSGEPIDNITVSIYKANPDGSKGDPAEVFADPNGQIPWPNTVITGTSVTAGGTVYPLDPGAYWFPFLLPGDYIIEAVTDSTYLFGPSSVNSGSLSGNPNTQHFAVITGSYEEAFTVPENASPIQIDIPKDAAQTDKHSGLVMTKSAATDTAGLGEVVEYTLTFKVADTNRGHLNVKAYDTIPRGFRYVKDSARSSSIRELAQPSISDDGRTLTFSVGDLTPDAPITLTYLLKVGIDASMGDAVNTVFATDSLRSKSNVATAVIRVKDDLHQQTNQVIGQLNVNSCEAADVHAINLFANSISADVVQYTATMRHINHNTDSSEFGILLDDALELVADSVKYNGKSLKTMRINGEHSVYLPSSHETQSQLTFSARITDTSAIDKKAKATVRFTRKGKRYTLDKVSNDPLASLQLFSQPSTDSTLEYISDSKKSSNISPSLPKDLDLSGVRILMEDGRYAITDKAGRFHLDDLSNGTHVLQLDTVSLPEHLEISPCVNNTRFAGSSISQFVDLKGATLWRSDFYVRETGKSRFKIEQKPDEQAAEHTSEKRTLDGDLEETKQYSKAWLNQQAEQFMIHEPTGDNANFGFINVVIQHPNGNTLKVELNGEPINPANLSGAVKGDHSVLTTWAGVHIKDGNNVIKATLLDANKKTVNTLTQSVLFSSDVANVRFIKEKSTLVADGKTPPVIAVQLLNSANSPVHSDLAGTFQVSQPHSAYVSEEERSQNNVLFTEQAESTYLTKGEGIAYIKLAPTTQAGKVTLTFNINNSDKTVNAWLTPQLRDWILVGLAEGSVVDSKIKAHMEELSTEELADSYQQDGRVAFFAKGKIKGKWLMTIAYDTAKERKRVIERESIDPDLYFTLYGDSSSQYQDALSSDKLYLKIENSKMSAMFGDFSTNLNTTELSKYSRSFTGFKAEAQYDNVSVDVFSAKEDSNYQREEFESNGTTGPYSLNSKNILINTEKVSIETRSRSNPNEVLKTVTLRRHIDYSLDYYTGRLTLSNIASTTDNDFNPNYLVAEYELNAFSDGKSTMGGRIAYQSNSKKVEVGATYVDQNATDTQGSIAGLDVTYKPNASNEVTVETAKTSNDTDNGKIGARAYLAKYKFTHNDLTLESRAERKESGFGLGQQSKLGSDEHYYDVKANAKLTDKITVRGDVSRREKIDSNETFNQAGTSVAYNHEHGSVEAGFKRTDLKTQTERKKHDIATAGIQQRFGKLNTYARVESALNNDANGNKPQRATIGSSYDINSKVSVFEKSEFTKTDGNTSKRHQAGLKLRPWTGAEVSTAVNRTTEDGTSADYANYTLSQSKKITEKTSLKASFEQGRDISSDSNALDGFSHTDTVSKNYTAASIGIDTRHSNWSMQQRVETRKSDDEKRYGVTSRWYRPEKKGVAYGLQMRAFSVDDKKEDTLEQDVTSEASVVYRPYGSKWTVMDRFKLTYNDVKGDDTSVQTRKAVNHLRTNYQHDDKNQVSFGHGIKHIMQDHETHQVENTLVFVSSEYRRDLTEKVDVGIHGSALHDVDSNSQKHAVGVDVGVTPFKNAWASIGYNFTGFKEEDFDELEHNNEGWKLKLRVKVDQNSFK